MKRTIIALLLVACIGVALPSCHKQPEQGGEEEKKDVLVGTKWSAPHIGSEFRYFEFFENGRAKISFSDRTKTFDGTYSINNTNDIVFIIGYEILGYDSGVVHSYNYSYKTGKLEGNKIYAKGVIYSDTASDGQEFTDTLTKVE